MEKVRQNKIDRGITEPNNNLQKFMNFIQKRDSRVSAEGGVIRTRNMPMVEESKSSKTVFRTGGRNYFGRYTSSNLLIVKCYNLIYTTDDPIRISDMKLKATPNSRKDTSRLFGSSAIRSRSMLKKFNFV